MTTTRLGFLKRAGAAAAVVTLGGKASALAATPAPIAELPPLAGMFPIGTVVTAVGAVPPNWLLCDGSRIDPKRYSVLLGLLGDAYGQDRLPDLRGRVIAHSQSPSIRSSLPLNCIIRAE